MLVSSVFRVTQGIVGIGRGGGVICVYTLLLGHSPIRTAPRNGIWIPSLTHVYSRSVLGENLAFTSQVKVNKPFKMGIPKCDVTGQVQLFVPIQNI